MSITNGVARLGQFKLFEGLAADELSSIAMLVDERFAPVGEELYRQGEMPTHLYLVENGEVLVEGHDPSDPKRVNVFRVAERGDLVGRRAAIEGVRHLATATVRQDASLLAISLGNLRILLSQFPLLRDRLSRNDVVNRLMAMPLFSAFDQTELIVIADLVRVVDYVRGATIFRRGELADAMYVIDSGQVVQSLNGESSGDGGWPMYIAAGNFFGTTGLRQGSARRANAVAETDVRLFRISREGVDWLRKFKPEFTDSLQQRPNMVSYLGDTYLFSKLNLSELRLLAGFTGQAHYRPGSIVVRQGEVDQTLYILYEGLAHGRSFDAKGQAKPLEKLSQGAVVGEPSLFLGEPQAATVESPLASSWLYISRDDLDRYLSMRPDVREKLVLRPSTQERQHLKRHEWMDPDERVLFRQRRHWFALAERVFGPLLPLLIGLLFCLLVLLGSRPVLLILGLPLAVAGLAWLTWVILDWGNDYFLVTSKRVVHIEKVILTRESRDEVPLDKVQDIKLSAGPVANWLGFGTLIVETASASSVAPTRFDYLSNPGKVQELIFTELSHSRAIRRQETQRTIQEKLAARMGTGTQPRVPPIATAPYVGNPATPTSSSWLSRIPRWNPLWIERKTPDEVTWRKHWINLLARVWIPSLAIIAAVAVLVFFLASGGRFTVAIQILAAIILVPAILWWLWGYVNWGNDLYTVTNDRLIDVEKLPLRLKMRRTETLFDRVQNVSFTIPNPLATLLNYGTVIIHTAGAQGSLDFLYVSHPQEVQTEIFRRLTAYNETRRRREREDRWADLPEWFANYTEMMRRNQP